MAEKSEYDKGYDDGMERIIHLISTLLIAGDYAEALIDRIHKELEKE